MSSFLKILFLILIVLLGVAVLGVYWTFYRPLPDYQADYSFQELQQEAQIHWDSYGVPHIYAKNKHDLYFSLGFVHAQDRLWQMTLTQMASEGRLAEFLGKELVPADVFQRTIGFWQTAKQIQAQLPDSTLQVLQAYADGVNAYVREHPRELPLEFSLVGMEPIKWTVTHSIALSRLMAWELNIAWKNELSLAYLDQYLTPAQFQELLPDGTPLAATRRQRLPKKISSGQFSGLLKGDQQLRQVLGAQGFSQGSNAWAVSAQKSDTDYPLLAGDPHLGLNMPGKWYEVHLNLAGRNLSGATLAGAPIVVLGQNDVLGWSFTNVMIDDSDFFAEQLNPADSSQYLVDSLAGDPIYEQFQIQRELIKVRDNADTIMTRRLTKHGPVISDIYPQPELIDDQVVAMSWTGYNTSNEIDALLGINWSQSFSQFQQYLPQFKVPGQNIVYADTSGNIALFSLGSVPVRNGNPVAFRRGWNPDEDWQGYIPFNEMPKIVNPESGWVANANNPVNPNYPYYISTYWEPDSRYDRIRQYLTQNEQLSPEVFQAMQFDSYSHYARHMVDIILPILKDSDKDFSTVISYLENWDYRYESNETAASIIDTFVLKLCSNTFLDEFGETAYSNFINYSGLPARVLLHALQENSSFFDNTRTGSIETREEMVVQTMQQTVGELQSKFGSEPYEWRWEKLHTLTLKPQLFGQAAENPDASSALKLIVTNIMNKGPYPARGDRMSLNNGAYSWTNPFDMIVGPSIRRIVDFSDLSRTLSITPTGQSGQILSEYYGDQTESWLNGQYKFVYQDSSFFEETTHRTMHLHPVQ